MTTDTQSPASAAGNLAAHYSAYAKIIESRLTQTGHPDKNRPSVEDIWRLVRAIQHLETLAYSVEVGEANALRETLADISEKWVDPYADPIDAQIYEDIERFIDDLVKLISANFPGTAESLEKWNSLRKLQHAVRRTVYLRERSASAN